jgi:2-iminoacetate synthase ThiH
MDIEIKFAQLHDTLFLGGTNLGVSLDYKKRPMKLLYDRTEKELKVWFNKDATIIPTTNVRSMSPVNLADMGAVTLDAVVPTQAVVHKGKVKAQHSSPTDHVFAEGPGKVRD